MRIRSYIMSCPKRNATLQETLYGLANSGWIDAPPVVVLDDGQWHSPIDRIHSTWRKMVQLACQSDTDYVLLLEDDLIFTKWFAHNLFSWPLLKSVPRTSALYASLYNPGHPVVVRREAESYVVADPRWAWGSQALLLSLGTVRYVDRHWDTETGNPDVRMPRLVRPITPVYYHLPSLVQHAPAPTTWGGMQHTAIDFDPDWIRPGTVFPSGAYDHCSSNAATTRSTTASQSPSDG